VTVANTLAEYGLGVMEISIFTQDKNKIIESIYLNAQIIIVHIFKTFLLRCSKNILLFIKTKVLSVN
jgi:hypothetical protein